jgi:hypothetical protein
MMAAYAEKTKTPVQNTITEIQRTVAKFGGEQFLHASMEDRLVVGFSMEGRQVRFQVPQYQDDGQRSRSVARALFLVLKAKLVAVDSGVSVFEDEFLGNIVLPDGRLLAQHVKPHLITAYSTGEIPPMLPDYSGE